jgi:DNA-binding NarL/FixJ family response regulator
MGVRVLIVDDQPSFRRIARAVVELTPGFELAGEAASGEASLEAARRLRPDLVLMDVQLPGIDGREATRRILTDADCPVPVIFLLSTYEANDYADITAETGAAAYLSKAEFGVDALLTLWSAARGSAS